MASNIDAGDASDCEGEEQEDPSSSHIIDDDDDVARTLDRLNLEEDKPNKPIPGEDELQAFRQQWQRELETTPSRQKDLKPKVEPALPLTDEEKAEQLFRSGVELERSGKLYEAIQHYKRAMQIVPDIETRLYENDFRTDTPDVDEEEEEMIPLENSSASEDEDAVEGEDLGARFQRILAKKTALFQPETPTKSTHLSSLPYEVLLVIARWVVSAELDAMALERLGGTCRGLYLLAREADLWRALCVRTWGIECGSPRAGGYGSWRAMFVRRPRLLLHGCYISKTTYLRHGEHSFQDHLYRPWYLIEYYRYLRFFPEGVVLSWTTADEPAACVGHLKHRHTRAAGVSVGHYRLIGDKVVIVIKKCNSDKKPESTRFRARRKEQEHQETTFHLELELRDVRGRRNWQLQWRRYAVSARRDQWTQFDLSPGKFPPFAFSRVRAYSAETHAPLRSTAAYT